MKRREYTAARREYNLRYKANHRKELAEQELKRYYANRDAIREKDRAKYKLDTDRQKANQDRVKKWAKANPEKKRLQRAACNRKRRAIGGSHFSTNVVRTVLARENYRCHICGKKIQPGQVTFDHIVPVSMGGTDESTNLRLAHLTCNSRRGAGRIPAQCVLMEVLTRE